MNDVKETPRSAAPNTEQRPQPHAPDQLMEAGKRLRDKVPRKDHATWKKRAAAGFDPIEILRASDADRLPELVPIRYGRMLQSPFAFYRGSAGVMAADLAHTPATGIRVQACGDCHLVNFGAFATPERSIIFDINDFDETLPGPWEWDVKRLAASMVLAGRSCNVSESGARDAAAAAVRSYRKRITEFAGMHPLDVWYARITAEDLIGLFSDPDRRAQARRRMAKAIKSTAADADFPKLAGLVGGQIHIRDTPPLIYHPEEARRDEFLPTVERILDKYRETLPEDRRELYNQYRLVDAAIKVVGVGSVGRRCWVVLMMSASNDPLFLQVKEAAASVLEPYVGASAYAHHGQRVVMGQRLMQPSSDIFLGWLTGPTGRQFYVRQLRDAKIRPLVETFDEETLITYGKACGWVLARAHAKAGGAATIAGYLGSSAAFDDALADFAVAYADQAERDHAALKAAVRAGKIDVLQEEA